MIREKHPQPPIIESKNTSVSRAKDENQNTYWIFIATTIAGFVITVLFVAFPIAVNAFWPFLISQAAQDSDTTMVHDSTYPLLDAATNLDPNPSKGGLSIATTEGSALIASGGPVGSLPTNLLSDNNLNHGDISLYLVREGDSLSEIAEMFGVSVNTILWANEIKDASTIQPGDTLLILPVSGVQYTVKRGGTLSDVAKLFDADVTEIALFNGIDASAPLAAGTELIIPGGNLVAKTTQKTAATGKSGATPPSKPLPELTGYYGNPVPGARLTQGLHGTNGVDLGAPKGTPVYASASGTVIVAKGGGGYNGGYGNYIVISHDNGTQTLYAHLSSLSVSSGEVAKGDLIGAVGNTGRSTGFHLHFEVRGAKNPFAQ